MTGNNRQISVTEWADIESVPDLNDREKQEVAELLRNGTPTVVWVEEWLRQQKNLDPVTGCPSLFTGDVADHSDKAWRVTQGGETEYLPKSCSVVIEADPDCVEIRSPQTGLGAFAASDSA